MNKIRALLLRPFTRAVLTGYRPTPGPVTGGPGRRDHAVGGQRDRTRQ